VKRIKQIIESFLNIGRDPGVAISSTWARVAASASTSSQEDLALIDRLVGGVLQQAAEMQARTAKSVAEAKS
jgi:hypothetical protein